MTITKIHHINFLVNNLEESIERYQSLLGIGKFIVEALPQRGVKTARVALGEQWLVLVEPVDPNSIPGRHLSEHGEGFFLISYACDDLQAAAEHVASGGGRMTAEQPRRGLENWLVWDIESNDTFGAQIQLCSSGDDPGGGD